MELKDSPAEAQFRATARAWLQETLPRLGGPEPARLEDKLGYWRTWQRLLYDAGYAGLSWPKEYGGGGADAKLRAVFNEELDRAGAPERLNIIGEDFAGPTVIEFGTPAQQERYLRPILTGEEIWCQLFSEPEAGSDLASLRTSATKVDGGWRIQGQKIWTSRAQLAAHAILLARTGGGPATAGLRISCSPWTAPACRSVPWHTCWVRPNSTRCSSTGCSSPTTACSVKWTAAGESPWAPSRSSGSPSLPAASTPPAPSTT
jgi:alkylation response protein AidB-like acyl-CoA dehydrogenase